MHAATHRIGRLLSGGFLCLAGLFVDPSRVVAQSASSGSCSATPDSSHGWLSRDSTVAPSRSEPVLGVRDGVWMLAFGVGTAVAYHNDLVIARTSQRRAVQDNATLRGTAAVFRAIGQPAVLLGAITAYGVGRATHHPVVATAGLRVTEAIVVAGVLTSAGKFVAGRARPFVSHDSDHADFHLWRGRRQGYTSMPSGHTSAAFAAASALSVEWRAALPGSARVAVPLFYVGASLVGASRVYHDRHWASDVVAGAALGALSGTLLTRWTRAHGANPIERRLLPIVRPTGDNRLQVGGSLSW